MRSKVFRLSADAAADRRCFYYFLMAVIVIRYETAATARWTSQFIVRAFFNDTITVAVWTGFHARLIHILPHPSNGRAAMGGMMQMAVLFAGASPLYPPKADVRRMSYFNALNQSRIVARSLRAVHPPRHRIHLE